MVLGERTKLWIIGQNSNVWGYSSPVQVPGTWDGIIKFGTRGSGAFKAP